MGPVPQALECAPACRRRRRRVGGDRAGTRPGATPTDIYVELLAPVLRQIGARWERGTLSIAEEHRATAAARRVVGRVTPRFARRGRSRGTVLLGGVAGDSHELPLAMLADVLRGAAFDVVDLGANTPVESMLQIAGQHEVLAVGISASTDAAVKAANTTVRALHRDYPGLPVLVGGAAVTASTADALGADGWAPDARAAIGLVEGLLR